MGKPKLFGFSTVEERDKAVIRAYKEPGATLKGVAGKIGAAPKTIHNILIKHGIKVRDIKFHSRCGFDTVAERNEEIARLYSEGLTGAQVGAKLGVKRSAVYGALRASGVKIRGARSPISRARQKAALCRFDIGKEWFLQFDQDRAAYLAVLEGTVKFSSKEDYKRFIIKFYEDPEFNRLYDLWKETGDRWYKPSLDHINPRSAGGGDRLDNLQIISWLANRAKADQQPDKWEERKKRIETYF